MKRREFIKHSTLSAFSVAALGAVQWNGKGFAGDSATTTDILGPYYRPGSPMRHNLIPAGCTGDVMLLDGTVFQQDGLTPMPDTLIEAWQCDEHENYDNTSDDYTFRGAVRTGADGKYHFRTMVPIPYKNGADWRPAHIHLRVSSGSHQDLITQIYFKNDPYIAKDSAAGSPKAIHRILEIGKNAKGERTVNFDIIMGKAFPIDDSVYKQICGLYELEQGNAEFYNEDDLLFVKLNGHLREALVYKGENTFEGAIGYLKAKFTILPDHGSKVSIFKGDFNDLTKVKTWEGKRFLKYNKQ